jgi:hypothetical protein
MAKEAPFDPCRQWLGIDAVHLGNARLVLGISPDEVDPVAVFRAADARLTLLRSISPGPFEMARTGLIARVEEAREKLLAECAATPQRPRLSAAGPFAMPPPPSQRAASSPQPPPMPPTAARRSPSAGPVPAVAEPPPVPGGAFDGGGVETITIRTTVYRKKTPVAGIALTVLALSAVAGGLLYFAVYGNVQGTRQGPRQVTRVDVAAVPRTPDPQNNQTGRPAQPSAHTTVDAADEEPLDPTSDEAVSTSKPPSARKERDRQPASEPDAQTRSKRQKEPTPVASVPMKTPVAAEPEPAAEAAKPEGRPDEEAQADAPVAVNVAKKNSQLDATLSELLESLRQQDDDSVARLLAEAAAQASGPEEVGRVSSWKQLATFYKGFMGYRQKALNAVQPGNEFDVANRKIAVVEIDADKFIYRSAGGNKTVPRDKIPAGIVLAIVMQWFDSNPANDLYIGAYHLAKPEPDPEKARFHWKQAEAAGADASDLVPLLDDPVLARSE